MRRQIAFERNDRKYAEAKRRLDRWKAKRKARLSRAMPFLSQLLERKERHKLFKGYKTVEALRDASFRVRVDRPFIWNTPDGRIFVFQPYKTRFDEEDEEHLAAVCATWGFCYRISESETWYYPGLTVLVEVWKDDTQAK